MYKPGSILTDTCVHAQAKKRALLVIVAALALAWTLAGRAPVRAEGISDRFTFGKVDLNFLEQCDLLDRRLENEGLVYVSPALDAYVDRVGRSVLPPGAAPERVQWRFRVLRDPLANAFALPNGSIYVNTGLLALLENESQLASVLSHEAAHVIHRHSYRLHRGYRKRMVAAHVIQAAGTWVPIGGGIGITITVLANVTPVMLGTTVNGYSRDLEREADLYGVARLAELGYDPGAMIETFKLLQQTSEVELTTVYYNDHPKLRERIGYVRAFIESRPSSGDPPAREDGRERYRVHIEPAARHNIHLEIEGGQFRTAVALAQKLVDFDPKSSENLCALAEAYQALGPRTPQPSAQERSAPGKRRAKKLRQQATLDEEERILLATPAGRSAWEANLAQAEAWYRKALERDGTNAQAHRGLGALFEKAQKPERALEEYRRYLALRPDAADRPRIARHIEALEKNPKLKSNTVTESR